MHGLAGLSVKVWLEEELWACDSDSSWNVDDSLVWKSVWLVGFRGCSSSCFLIIVLGGNIA